MRWVHEFGPEIDKRIRSYLKPSNDSWRTDETYIVDNTDLSLIKHI
jgi:IS6 family transposase